jgi:poly-gamma-glutamate capsule biosynthesis protein CapA/YwtB (metallophosphatase superfamily)
VDTRAALPRRWTPGVTAVRGSLSRAWRQAAVPEGFTLVTVGDLVLDSPLSARLEARSPRLIELLRRSDVTFGNFEMTALDLPSFDGWPEAQPGGSWLIGTPEVPADLRRMGFDLVSRANNHATDWGVAGMRATDALLTAAGIVHAGTGESLAAARAPRRLTVSAGRVALVAAASTFQEMSRAADPSGHVPGRPGVNALRAERSVLVSEEQLAVLAEIRYPHGRPPAGMPEADGAVTLAGTRFVAGAQPDLARSGLAYAVHPGDREAVLREVRQAKQTSDFAVFSLHTHEPGNGFTHPPAFVPELAKAAVDNGADAVVGHGPHRLRGIEVYRGRPVFYSLGNFFFLGNTQHPLTPETWERASADGRATTEAELLERKRGTGTFADRFWYESVVAVSRFDRVGELVTVELHPVELHWDGPRDADRGIPELAGPEAANRILEELRELSRPYGTEIEILDGVGVITAR